MLNAENRYLFKFAWRSIRRNAGRSFFIVFSVTLAVFVAIWVVAFFKGMNAQIEKSVVNTNTGFFQIQDPLYAKTTDSSAPKEFTQDISQKLVSPNILSASPELVLDGNISTPEGAAALLILGISPSLHQKLLPLKQNMLEGEFIQDSSEDEVSIGKELADIFKFKAGDQLVINYQDANGELRSEILNIKGIYHYNSKSFEKRFVYITQKTWQKLFFGKDLGKTYFNRITLLTPDLDSEDELKNTFTNTDLKIKTWKQLNPEMGILLEFHDGMIRFFFIIIGITIIMTILTPVRMLWQERFKEIKMMNIIGVSVSKFWKIGIFEIVIMTFISGISSLISIVTIIGYQAYTGIDFRFLHEGVAIERSGIKIPGIIFPKLSINELVTTLIFVVFILSISYLWSISRTLRNLEVNE